MFKPKPSLLAATVTQQGQDTGHHMELQQPQALGLTHVLSAEHLSPHTQVTQRDVSVEHHKLCSRSLEHVNSIPMCFHR